MAEKRQPWDEVTRKARDFIQNWTSSVGDLLKQADLHGQKTLMRSLTHRLELQPDAEEKGAGTYRLMLNPGWQRQANENEDSVLTESPLVRQVSEKAPRDDAQRNFFGVVRPAFLQAETRGMESRPRKFTLKHHSY
jgi:hypothetical protein